MGVGDSMNSGANIVKGTLCSFWENILREEKDSER